MTKPLRGLPTRLGIVLLVLGLSLGSCMPARPSGVPPDSAYVVGAYKGWWERCSFDSTHDADQCQIFNAGGELLHDEVFLPYDGGEAARASELKIDTDSNLAGPQYVCLTNGRILIPKSDFEGQKRYLDWATGKSRTR
jgi:hypothetical protein